MLDKLAERILMHINSKCDNIENPIEVCPSDVGVSYSMLNSIVEDLRQKEYINTYIYSSNDKEPIEVYLSYKGYSYFEYKNIEKNFFYKKLLTSSFFNIIVSVVAAILTTLILAR